jgi:competence protein ComFC
MINILKKLLDFIYYKKCYICSEHSENVFCCSNCFNSIKLLKNNPLYKIDQIEVYSATYYRDIVKKIIRAIKYHNQKNLAYYQAKIMYNFWKENKNFGQKYIVIPVPMFFSKIKKRKYNHMDLVCREFCKLTNYDFDLTSLIRNRETKPQYNLSKKEREENLKDAFTLLNNKFNFPILLIDDISTTGTTIKEIIKEFKKNNITNIVVLVTSTP